MSKRIPLLIGATIPYVASLVWLVPANKQCPDTYTQAQVDATGCIVGADMGTPVILLLLTAVWLGVCYVIWDRWSDD